MSLEQSPPEELRALARTVLTTKVFLPNSKTRNIMSRLNQQLRLPGGRLLVYDEYGAPDGAPIFYFHGSPSSRLEWGLFGGEMLANKLNIRVIVPDRPGLGRSEIQAGRQIGDWPADVVALINSRSSASPFSDIPVVARMPPPAL
jgi:hypothetical protein